MQIVVAVGLLFYVLGVSALGGVVFMILSVPLGKWTTSKTQKFQKILMKRKDDRMSIVGETMQVSGGVFFGGVSGGFDTKKGVKVHCKCRVCTVTPDLTRTLCLIRVDRSGAQGAARQTLRREFL